MSTLGVFCAALLFLLLINGIAALALMAFLWWLDHADTREALAWREAVEAKIAARLADQHVKLTGTTADALAVLASAEAVVAEARRRRGEGS